MKRTAVVSVILLLSLSPTLSATTGGLTLRSVAQGLRIPWEIQWGPDNALWTTERGGIVSRIDPEMGTRSIILDHSDKMLQRGEGGMLGLALHPQFPDSAFVYLAINYGTDNTPEYRTIERWAYDAAADSLVSGTEIFRITPAAIGHQGCRLAFGPDGMLYVTTGDNHGDGWVPQDPDSPLGKVLRLRPDGSIPDDNPVPGNPFWSLGHRNPQGLTILPDGTILTSEHGNIIEDEVNMIVKGANYGWPGVEGPCDDEFEQDFCDSVNPGPPFYSSGPEDTDAYSDLDFYDHERYPVFQNSLLMATLKRSTLFQLHLNEDRAAVDSVTHWFPYGVGRIRDIEVSPEGRIFICTSNRDPNGKAPFPIDGDDRIYELVPVDTGAYAILEGPDTIRVETYEDETVYFSADVTNTGTAPTLITDIERVITSGPLDHAHWRKPFVIMPGMTYPVDLRYFPWESGDHVGQVRLLSDNSDDLDIHLVGKALPTSVLEGAWSDDLDVHPQPFSASVRIAVPETIGSGTASILDLDGRLLWKTPVEGSQTLIWHGTDNNGSSVSTGTYVLVLTDGTSTHRTLLHRRP